MAIPEKIVKEFALEYTKYDMIIIFKTYQHN